MTKKLVRKLTTALALSTLLTSGVVASGYDDCHEPSKITRAAATHCAISKTGNQENKWWNDYLRSDQEITQYVHNLSDTNPEAAMWFLFTGGKNGFSSRTVTDVEQGLLLSAIKKVAASFYRTSQTQGLETWKAVTDGYNEGHQHVKMLYKEVDDLKRENQTIKRNLSEIQRTVELTQKKHEITLGLYDELKKQNDELKKQNERLNEKIDKERYDRIADLKAQDIRVLDIVAAAEEKVTKRISQDIDRLIKEKDGLSGNLIKMIQDSKKEFLEILATTKAESEKRDAQEKNDRLSFETKALADAKEREERYKTEVKEREERYKAEVKEREERYKAEAKEKEENYLNRIRTLEKRGDRSQASIDSSYNSINNNQPERTPQPRKDQGLLGGGLVKSQNVSDLQSSIEIIGDN